MDLKIKLTIISLIRKEKENEFKLKNFSNLNMINIFKNKNYFIQFFL